MIVEIEDVIKMYTSCNFCSRGELKEWGIGFRYPYHEVYTMVRDGNGVKVAICEECIKELYSKYKLLSK